MSNDKWIVVPEPVEVFGDNGSAVLTFYDILMKVYLNDNIFGIGDDALTVRQIIADSFKDVAPGKAVCICESHYEMLRQTVTRPNPSWRTFLMAQCRSFNKAVLKPEESDRPM